MYRGKTSRNNDVGSVTNWGVVEKPLSIKKMAGMAGYIKELHTTIFTGPTGCGKIHLVLDLTEKEY